MSETQRSDIGFCSVNVGGAGSRAMEIAGTVGLAIRCAPIHPSMGSFKDTFPVCPLARKPISSGSVGLFD